MDPIRLGRQLRALRIRRDLRQEDVGLAAKLSRATISRLERGKFEEVAIGVLVRVAAALGASVDIRLRWNGEQLDRLLDEAHAWLIEGVVLMLRTSGWDVAVEVSFSVWGERGSIDVFAYHRLTGIVLVVEVKSILPDSQATIHGLDRKTRLAAKLAEDRGWKCRGVARLLVVGATDTSRRRVARLAATYEAAFPMRGPELRQWLHDPRDPVSGLLFLSYDRGESANAKAAARLRVRRRRSGLQRPRRAASVHRASV
jgi:transcriptional regulator with XRE-family HTH domain